jgi:hypothetical protein
VVTETRAGRDAGCAEFKPSALQLPRALVSLANRIQTARRAGIHPQVAVFPVAEREKLGREYRAVMSLASVPHDRDVQVLGVRVIFSDATQRVQLF